MFSQLDQPAGPMKTEPPKIEKKTNTTINPISDPVSGRLASVPSDTCFASDPEFVDIIWTFPLFFGVYQA
jgi:hypothetical protein